MPGRRLRLVLVAIAFTGTALGGCVSDDVGGPAGGPDDRPWESRFLWDVPEGITDLAIIVELEFLPGHECQVAMEYWGRDSGEDGASHFSYSVDANGTTSVGWGQRGQWMRVKMDPIDHVEVEGRSTWLTAFNGTSTKMGNGLASIKSLHGYDRAIMGVWYPDDDRERHNIDIECTAPSVRPRVEMTQNVTRFQSSGRTEGQGVSFYPAFVANAEINPRNVWRHSTQADHTFVGIGTSQGGLLSYQEGSVEITGPTGSTVTPLIASDLPFTHVEIRDGAGDFSVTLQRVSTMHMPVMGFIASFDHRPALFPGPP